jgi:hypothetical protein
MYDLVKQTRGEIRNFLDETISITSIPAENGRTYDYKFSQRTNIALIDMYWNSQFTSGPKDKAGHEKIFLNVGKFRTEVAEMQVDIDVSNFLFIPTSADYWTPWFLSKDFLDYVREHDYGELINEWGADYPRYGTAVSKRVGDEVQRVAIKRLMNSQDATTLKNAAMSGGYVIEQMELTKYQIEQYPDWNIGNLAKELDGSTKFPVYERYGLITEADIEMAQGKEVKHRDSQNFFLGMSVVATDVSKEHKGGGLLFCEEVKEDDFPYDEVHWARQDGRWQGIGVMEEQFQNQLAKNLTTHYRMKSMMWAGKKMFQKNTADGPDNLAREVEDGGVVNLGVGGQMTLINTQSQHLGDIQSFDNVVDVQADKTSFTYEGATGDSPKAGTPYSLQVIVDETLQKHFGKKKEKLGAYLRRVFFNQQVKIFQKERSKKDRTMSFAMNDEGVEMLREAMIELKTAQRYMKQDPTDRRSLTDIREAVTQEFIKSPYMLVDIPKETYKDAKFKTDLILTGERRNVLAEMETLKTLLADSRMAGDTDGANKYLRELVSLTGRMPMSAAKKPAPVQPIAPQPPQQPSQPEIQVV